MILTNDIIYKYFDEFKKEQKCENLPKFSIDANDDDDSFGRFNFNELQNKQYILHLNYKLENYPVQFIKSIFWHEFTHFYDYCELENKLNAEDLLTYMTSDSEYHAAQNELMCQIKYSLINEKKVVLYYENKECTLQDYIIFVLSNLTTIIDADRNKYQNYTEEQLLQVCTYAQKFLFYYLGKLKIAQEFSQNQIIDLLPKNSSVFQSNINTIKTVLDLTLGNVEKGIKAMKSVLKGFERDFILYYKCGEKPIR